MQMQTQMQMQMLLPFVWSGISASDELGLLPPPLAGEGWGGGERAQMNLFACALDLVACPLPIPPAEVGYIRLRPIYDWPNSGKPEFGCKRVRECTECAALTASSTNKHFSPS
jgi:hypothetical protein